MIARRVALGVAAAAMALTQLAAAQPYPSGQAVPPQTQTPPPADVSATVEVAPAVYQPQDKDERGLWMQMAEQERDLKNSNFVIRDAALNDYVRRVFCRTVGPRCSEVRIYVTRTAYFNANIAPNGMMQVWSGLLLRTRNEAQLAAVLAHEYVHYENRHSLLLFREVRARAAGAAWLSMFGLVGALIALGEVSAIFRFSREQEAAADAGSVEMIARAGYDPNEAPKIWEQFREEADATAAARGTKSRKDKNGGLFASHPPSAERVTAMTAEAKKIAPSPGWTSGRREYVASISPFWTMLVDDQIKLNDFGATDFLLAHLANEGWTPTLNYARGELYRSRGRPDDLTAAVGFYRQASTAPDAPVETWRGLGLALLRSGDQPAGQTALKSYLERKPDAPDKSMIAMLAGGTQ
ncbi:M48 family metallopeptidase [Sphingomonas bacterium]|uniref:M48 family metallopeptidase n=1 Tax=Sphingomonas bacterium TaxID=1895847 RepID=UPI0026131801|nr:M48 family metallopeptidase [Sphingomonas bacterium]MDB5678928.1 yfgC 2 [Sphingomonas bacterium]